MLFPVLGGLFSRVQRLSRRTKSMPNSGQQAQRRLTRESKCCKRGRYDQRENRKSGPEYRSENAGKNKEFYRGRQTGAMHRKL